jgi:hypothetical protein
MRPEILTVLAFSLAIIFVACASMGQVAEANHVLHINLHLNNTDSGTRVYIPGTGEAGASPSSNATYTHPTHFYITSHSSDDMIRSLIYSHQQPISIGLSGSGTYHALELDLNLTNSQAFLAFTKGDWPVIDSRMGLIEARQFLSRISPSFSYGMGSQYRLRILLEYINTVDLEGRGFTLQRGNYQLELESNKTGSQNKVIIRV